ncbi:hypothetical protein FOCC_FOCC014649 [Frankliniella occidentalis]|nr:hypothetical protein FOCC_FOCC014649 [Frankliniella occidentalis]
MPWLEGVACLVVPTITLRVFHFLDFRAARKKEQSGPHLLGYRIGHQKMREYAHFLCTDFVDMDKKKLLKKEAVPSVRCNNQECLSDIAVDRPAQGVVVVTPSPSAVHHAASCCISVTESLRHATPVSRSGPKIEKRCMQLRKENIQLHTSVINLKNQINSASQMVVKNQRRVLSLNQSLNKQQDLLNKHFGQDQMKAAETGNSRGREWTLPSIQKALDVRLAGGPSGLQAANDSVFPLPTNRTLQRRLQPIKFQPGLLYEFLNPFAEKVASSFTSAQKDCALHFDEMATKSQLCFDLGTGRYFGNTTLPGVKGLATKLEVWTFGGIQTKWKLNAAYHLTPSRACSDVRANVVLELLDYAENAGLNCLALVCDMGNRGLLAELGFDTTKDGQKYVIPHPFNGNKNLYLVPDVVHIFKSLKEMLQNNEVAMLSEVIYKKYSLPSGAVRFQHIEWLIHFQEDMGVKFAPRLSKKDIKQNFFSKMNTSAACHIFDHKTGKAIEFLAEEGVFEEDSKTTAWFIELMNKWFTILTSRTPLHALSFKNMDKYNEAISMLGQVVEVFTHLSVGDAWKPCQTHVIMATEALLSIQDYLLQEQGYDFVFMGRFTNDISENIFSDVRKTRPTPTSLQAKYQLRLNTLSQCSRKVLGSQYGDDDRQNLLTIDDILEYLKRNGPQTPKESHPCPENDEVVLPWDSEIDPKIAEYKFQHLIVYRMSGYLLFNMRKLNQLKCDKCYEELQKIDKENNVRKWTEKTNYVEDAQVEVCPALFKLLQAIDYNINQWKDFLTAAEDALVLVNRSIREAVIAHDIPTCEECPNLKEAIVSRFVRLCLKVLEKKMMQTEPQDAGYQLSSKSMGYRYWAERYMNGPRKTGNAGAKK